MQSYKEALFKVKRNFLIIGLTGYTGSGCTTCKKILESETQPTIPNFESIPEYSTGYQDRDRRIYYKLANVWNYENIWHQFISIEISTIIFGMALYQAIFEFVVLELNTIVSDLTPRDKETIKNIELLWSDNGKDKKNLEPAIEAYQIINSLYHKATATSTQQMQEWGDNIRKYGRALCDKDELTIHPDNLFILPEAVRRLIKAFHEQKKTRHDDTPAHFVIDAFRNPFEIEYFKCRYSEFYLVGILRNQDERRDAIKKEYSAFQKILNKESGKGPDGNLKRKDNNISEWITSQNIDECLQKADMYIENTHDQGNIYPSLKFNIIKLISLVKKPGCIPPTRDERNMQYAMTARQISGCISRQVGAAIINEDGYAVGIGWNDPPSGQTPCSLRTAKELITGGSPNVFSQYERSSDFITHLQSKYNKDVPFCFREEFADIEGSKKAEFTRALHAEENAFFQTLKTSSGTLRNLTLYTTSRTCQLCAKKAYQLNVKRIVYIDDYSDIAIKQTIQIGSKKIAVEKFQGITGQAYFKLFSSLIPEKDLIQLYLEPSGSQPSGESFCLP